MAMKVLSDDEYSEFSRKFQALADSKKREEELSNNYSYIIRQTDK
jgi:hypothetical protein